MNKVSGQKKDKHEKLARLLPYASIAALVLASWFVLFHAGVDLMPSAQAQEQVNLGNVGGQVVETVTEAAGEREGQLGQSEQELAEPGSAEAAPEQEEEPGITMPEELPPGESAEPEEEDREPVYVGPDSPYDTSTEDLGGWRLEDMTSDQLRQVLMALPETRRSEAIVDLAMPIIQRFQAMIRPPLEFDQFSNQRPPWISEARRYSPFDPVGVQGTMAPSVHPVPPFRPIPGIEPGTRRAPEITAQDVADNLVLVGVMGEPGNFLAIINVAGDQKVLAVGDEVGRRGEYAYLVDEISLGQVRIVREGRPEDTGIMFFTETEGSGISEVSISY